MSIPINNSYTPIEPGYRQTGAPVTVGQVRRHLANAYHVLKRVTGGALTGHATNTVTGHGHTGDGDGLPMPRMLASGYAHPRLVSDVGADAGDLSELEAVEAGATLSWWATPLFDVLFTTESTRLRNVDIESGDWYNIGAFSWEDRNTTDTMAVVAHPTWRAVRIPPGCHAVGCRIAYTITHSTVGVVDPSVYVRLVSKDAATGDLDLVDGAAWTSDHQGGAVRLGGALAGRSANTQSLSSPTRYTQHWSVDGGYSTRINPGGNPGAFGEGLGDVRRFEVPIEQAWLGFPMASRNRAAWKVSQFDKATLMAGCCEVTPGAHSDIALEVRIGADGHVADSGDAAAIGLLIWGYQLYALPWEASDFE